MFTQLSRPNVSMFSLHSEQLNEILSTPRTPCRTFNLSSRPIDPAWTRLSTCLLRHYLLLHRFNWLWKSAVLLFHFHLPGPQRTHCVADIPGRYTEYRWIYTTNSYLLWRKVWVLPNDQLKWRRLKTHWEGPNRWPTTGSTFMKYSPRNVKCILLMRFPTMWNPTF